MQLGFVLLKGDLELAKEEVLSVLGTREYDLAGNLLLAHSELLGSELAQRLGMTSSVHEVLFSCTVDEVEHHMNSFDWTSVYADNFSIRIEVLTYVRGQHGGPTPLTKDHRSLPWTEKTLAAYIWRAVNQPRVKLRGAKTRIQLFVFGDLAVCTRLLGLADARFEERRPHLRAFAYSGGMHPRLVRALINLSGARKGETILDPCCGSGGMLIEAGLCGMRAEGYDVNRKMVWGCIRNMAQLKLLDYKVTARDVLQLEGTWDYIVTDLPYGLNSVIVGRDKQRLSLKKESGQHDIEHFYIAFFHKLKEILGRRAVIVHSHLIDGKALARQAGLKMEREFSQYVHGSLTRKIIVLCP